MATVADTDAIRSVARAADRTPPTLRALEAAIHDRDRLVVVAIASGHIVGWAKTHWWNRTDGPAASGHYLGGVTVSPDWRRLGIGAALTDARISWIWQRSADAWYVVNENNRASIDLHAQWEFEEVARGPRFHTTTFSGGLGILMRARWPRTVSPTGDARTAVRA